MNRITDIVDIEEAAKHFQVFLVSLQSSPDDLITHNYMLNLGGFFFHACGHTNNREYPNESIGVYRSVLKVLRAQRTSMKPCNYTPSPPPIHTRIHPIASIFHASGRTVHGVSGIHPHLLHTRVPSH